MRQLDDRGPVPAGHRIEDRLKWRGDQIAMRRQSEAVTPPTRPRPEHERGRPPLGRLDESAQLVLGE